MSRGRRAGSWWPGSDAGFPGLRVVRSLWRVGPGRPGQVRPAGDPLVTGPASFAEALASLISQAGYTQEDLAAKAGVGRSTISELTRGKHPTCHKTTAERLAGALALEGHPRGIFIAAARGLLPVTRLAEDHLWEQLIQQARQRGHPLATAPAPPMLG